MECMMLAWGQQFIVLGFAILKEITLIRAVVLQIGRGEKNMFTISTACAVDDNLFTTFFEPGSAGCTSSPSSLTVPLLHQVTGAEEDKIKIMMCCVSNSTTNLIAFNHDDQAPRTDEVLNYVFVIKNIHSGDFCPAVRVKHRAEEMVRNKSESWSSVEQAAQPIVALHALHLTHICLQFGPTSSIHPPAIYQEANQVMMKENKKDVPPQLHFSDKPQLYQRVKINRFQN
ncbi:hypothetical protein INR49_014580 [Caranx melampygus]|nr:hypothetical protein INR49_014580 [Caranx melampygus]